MKQHLLPLLLFLVLASPIFSQTPPPPVTTGSPLVDPGAVASPYVPDGYFEVFGDEFNGHALNTGKWWTRIIYNDGMLDRLNDEQQRYRENNNHVMTGTELQLTARKVSSNDPHGINYESGMIRSKVIFKYAYFEARIKMPAGKGVWPAFWMTSDANPKGHATWPPEMDVLEFVNNVKDDRPDMLHIGAVVQKGKNGAPSPWDGKRLYAADSKIFKPAGLSGYYYAPYNFPDGYHVFGLLWDTDDTLTWYVDGVELMKGRYKWVTWDGKDAPYTHVLLNLAIGGKWAGRYGIDDSAFPQAMCIDYVRVYQKLGHEQMGQSLVGHDLYKPPPHSRGSEDWILAHRGRFTGNRHAGRARNASIENKILDRMNVVLIFLLQQKYKNYTMNTLTPGQQKFILHWGELGTRWGINRTVAQLHALLFISAKPLNADEIVEALGVARSNISTSLKELQGWGIIRVVHIIGDRRDHFESLHDVFEMFRVIVDERKKREIDPTLTILRECLAEIADSNSPGDAVAKERLEELTGFFETMTGWYEQMRQIPTKLLLKGVKLGDKAFKLLGILKG